MQAAPYSVRSFFSYPIINLPHLIQFNIIIKEYIKQVHNFIVVTFSTAIYKVESKLAIL